MAYGVVHTTNLNGCFNYSFVNQTDDIENGSLTIKGNAVDDGRGRSVYNCTAPAGNANIPVYLVANPAWNYDRPNATSQNEDEFINKHDKPFRVYELRANRRFKVSPNMLSGPTAVGNYVSETDGDYKYTVSATAPVGTAFVGKVLAVDDVSFGTYVMGPCDLGSANQMVLIEVVKNASMN